MRLPMLVLRVAATASSRTVKANFSATVPGSVTSQSSPSQVLQIQPLRENFCTKQARSPSDDDQCSVSQVKPARAAIITTTQPTSTFMAGKHTARVPAEVAPLQRLVNAPP